MMSGSGTPVEVVVRRLSLLAAVVAVLALTGAGPAAAEPPSRLAD
jgi:hypothetical protein